MSTLNVTLPEFSEEDLQQPETIRKILEFLFQLNEQLRYMMTHLDEENLSDELANQIKGPEGMANLATRVEDVANGMYSYRKQTAEQIVQKVGRDEVVSAINQSAEMIQILASKLRLEGYVTINGTFTIDESGYLRCTGGTIGGFAINSGSLSSGSFVLNASGQSIQLGNMTISYNPTSYINNIFTSGRIAITGSDYAQLLATGGGVRVDAGGVAMSGIPYTPASPNMYMDASGRIHVTTDFGY